MSEIRRRNQKRADAKRQDQVRQDKARDTKSRNQTRQAFKSAMERSGKTQENAKSQQKAQPRSSEAKSQKKQTPKQALPQPKKKTAKESARAVLNAARQNPGASQKSGLGQQRATAHRAAGVLGKERATEAQSHQGELEGKASQSQERQRTGVETQRQVTQHATQHSQGQEATQRQERARETQDERQTQLKGSRAQRAVAGATAAAIEGVGSLGARTEGKPGAAGGPKIPQALLEALARKVFVGMDQHGDARFEIELGGNLLAGLRLRIQAKDGKVRIEISGDNREGGRMLAAHHTELAAVFRHKGLDLDELKVDEA